jgi:type IV pilus assembly protein PilX
MNNKQIVQRSSLRATTDKPRIFHNSVTAPHLALNTAAAMHRASIPPNTEYQSGVVMVVSLIILLLLTIIGINGMQSTLLEEKMAGNMRNRSLAFQAAEAALREAEVRISPDANKFPATEELKALINAGVLSGSATETCTSGLCSYNPNNTTHLWESTSFDWLSKGTAYNSGSLSKVAQAPRYVIEMIAPAPPGDTTVTFRITAIAWGGDTNTVVKLQTVNKVEYSAQCASDVDC